MFDVEEAVLQCLMRCDALLWLVLQKLLQQIAKSVNVRPHRLLSRVPQ